jgi:oligoendopeptidase F
MTPEERNQAWRTIEKKYLPHRDYDNNSFLEAGGFWQRQSHLFGMPFYYIDYVLAQICAFQFWKRSLEDKEEAWKDYIKLCDIGGSKSFLQLLEVGNLQSPFEDGCLAEVVKPIQEYLAQVDDSVF